MALKYYTDEAKRHPTASSVKLTQEQCMKLAGKICASYGVTTVPMQFFTARSGRGAWSWFRYQRRIATGQWETLVSINSKMMNILTVVHEVAHYIHFTQWMPKYEEFRAAGKRDQWSKPRAHGQVHKAIVDAEMEKLYTDGTVPRPVVEAPVAVEVAPTPVVAAPVSTQTPGELWWAALATDQCCSRCNKSKHKDQFGMRVVVPGVKFARQSYCSTCRKEYYEAKKAGPTKIAA